MPLLHVPTDLTLEQLWAQNDFEPVPFQSQPIDSSKISTLQSKEAAHVSESSYQRRPASHRQLELNCALVLHRQPGGTLPNEANYAR